MLLCAPNTWGQETTTGDTPPLNPSSYPEHLYAHEGSLYFVADDGIHGREIWRYTPATDTHEIAKCTLVTDLMPGQNESKSEAFFSAGEDLYFMAVSKPSKRHLFVLPGNRDLPTAITDIKGQFIFEPQILGANAAYLYVTASSSANDRWLYVLPRGGSTAEAIDPLAAQWSWGRRSAMTNDGALYYFSVDHLVRISEKQPLELAPFEGNMYLAFSGAMATLGDYVIFVGHDEDHGRELWRTDGTTEGTMLVKDIAEGPDSSRITGLCLWRDELYFGADDGHCGKELWKTDGTADGTRLILDHFPGPSDGDPHYFGPAEEWLFYLSYDGSHGKELWRTGGDPENTVLVADLRAGPIGSEPWDLTAFKRALYFCASSAACGEEIFISDGTPKGTLILKDIVTGEGNSGPDSLTVLGDHLYFTCDDGIHGEELWVTDGTPGGTRLAADIYPIRMNPSSLPGNLTAVGERVFFTVYHQITGEEVWVSDGTLDGTHLVRDIVPGAPGSSPADLTALGGQLFFTAQTGMYGRELWASDGTPEGTRLVEDIRKGAEGSHPHHLYADGESLFFAAAENTDGETLWRYSLGKGSLTKAQAPPRLSKSARMDGVFRLFDEICAYFVDTGGETCLCRVDTSKETLALFIEEDVDPSVSDVSDIGNARMSPAQLAWFIHPPGPRDTARTSSQVGELLLCVVHTPRYGAELFCATDNPPALHLVRDIFPGPGSSSPSCLCEAGGSVYFSAEHPTEGRMLWKTDGTTGGTGAVIGQADHVLSYMIPAYEIACLDNTLIVVSEPARPVVLTHENIELRFIPLDVSIEFDLLADIRAGESGSWPRQLTRAGNLVFFTADDGIHGEELWVTDGTGHTTHLVKDILAPGDLSPHALR